MADGGASREAVEGAGLSSWGRSLRLAAVALVFGALVAGTAWGDDRHFPLGPFRMYASTEPLDGTTTWVVLVAVGPDGRRREVPADAVGLRRAELEGRVAELAADPSLLADLAGIYLARAPSEALAGFELVRRSQPMVDGRPRGEVLDEVVVTWPG